MGAVISVVLIAISDEVVRIGIALGDFPRGVGSHDVLN